ncbi:lytic murein transglycosylase B [Rhodanobacter sp. DHB23]|uniref:lytic murein transglycosylase B n=1 Tax=Rhodanobacter sp. DHB23 TaxID=2775923 RepID=UPI001784EC9E|nr:lytic murein transglycosylase B [Rhodanobacter sp. DHB23]MBD8871457.1 lytic murein transglycosylase B [Rhodanobacter sp. DHB23]
MIPVFASRSIRPIIAALGLFLLMAAVPVFAETHPGQSALVQEVVRDTGKDPAMLNALLDQAQMQQSILDAMNRPAESKPWSAYRPIFLTQKRIDDGVAFYRANRALLERIGRQYGVEPQYLVAIIGVETFYGRITGKYKVLDALVTLGFYYPKRAPYFRQQLKTLLELPDNHLAGPLDTLTGSYAGAQGWGQFMPDSIRDFAVDEDGDGRIDLQNSLPDILASVANYFARHGWIAGGPVAARAQPDGAARPLGDWQAKPQWPLEQLEAWGYAPLQHLDPGEPTSLLTLAGAGGPETWFTFNNFQVITTYNRSPMYAMAVDQLAQAIMDGVHDADNAGSAQ